MKLRKLANLILVASLVVATGVGVAGFLIWQHTKSSLVEVDTLAKERDRAYRIDIAIRYLIQMRLDLEVLRGVAHESGRLAALLEDEPHPEAHTALLHLEEIETLANNALAVLEGRPDDASIPQRLAPVSGQMRIHETGALDALNRIIEDRNREIVATLQYSLGMLILIALVVALLGCLVFWAFYRRIRRPLRNVAEGVRRFGEGDESVRIAVNGHDELSDVARLFNQAMDQRAAYQLQLQERIKEQRCLYRVLELTTDENLSVAEVCREIAQLIPAHMLHEDAAMARVSCEVETFFSSNWAEPRASMSSPIRIDGKELGHVEVGYARELPDQPGGEGPFLAEERTLLDSIAMHLARMLQDRKLRDALARSQRLQAVGSLTGGIAHDFNNLLTVIQGNAELLCDMYSDHDAEAAELAGMIDSAARRGAELTHRLLAFARRQALEPRSIGINALIEDMRGLLQRTLGAHVALELKLGDDLWPALVDPAQLETALLNLVVNARDAMPESGWLTLETANVTLDADFAEARHEVTPGDYVRVAVSDTGTGMTPEVLERAFEPFFTTKPKDRGTGLGLSMVYGFVKQSSGHVAVYSEPGEGTTVRLYLPRAGAAEEVAEKPEIASMPRGEASVLLVEDDDLVRRYTHDQLAALGYRVQSAADGFEAKTILESDAPFDLLLTDIVMPGGMSGRDLARIAVELRPELKVLYMSGYTENAIVHHGRLDPGVSLLSKPFRRADLARKVHEGWRATIPGARRENMNKTAENDNEKRLLIVDDDEMVGRTLQNIARRQGFEVRFTCDAERFLELVEEWKPGVLAIDLVMPGMDGIEVLRRLGDQGASACVIVTSGVGHRVLDAAVRSAREHGLQIAGMLPKPFSVGDVARLLDQCQVAGSAEPAPRKEASQTCPVVDEALLVEALDNDQFHVEYQPKVRCADGSLAGFEALARWHHPELGPIPPDHFIPSPSAPS